MRPAHKLTFDVSDDLAEVGRVQEELASLWEARSLPPEIESPVSLALEEALSNVLRHGGAAGDAKDIRVEFTVDNSAFEFEISDRTPAYNPLLRPDPDINAPLEQRRPGGLGVFLLKRLADQLSYDYRDGRNHLRFRKCFDAPAD